jgi:hypothetical protein
MGEKEPSLVVGRKENSRFPFDFFSAISRSGQALDLRYVRVANESAALGMTGGVDFVALGMTAVWRRNHNIS